MECREYTARVMREAALVAETIEVHDQFQGHEMDEIAAMLRQAADIIEREAKRERKYEYTLRTSSGHSVGLIPTSAEQARRHMIPGDRLIRREVGEWEAFDDGQES